MDGQIDSFIILFISHIRVRSPFCVLFVFSAAGLRRPSGVSGWGDQGDCGSQRPWQGLCAGQPAWHLHQCTFLHAVDTQSLQILPQSWVGPKTNLNPDALLNLTLDSNQSSRALRTRGYYALLASVAHGSRITFDNALETDDEGMGMGGLTLWHE